MDVETVLADLLQMADEEIAEGDWAPETARERCERYGELVSSLDEWLSGRGFLPDAWKR